MNVEEIMAQIEETVKAGMEEIAAQQALEGKEQISARVGREVGRLMLEEGLGESHRGYEGPRRQCESCGGQQRYVGDRPRQIETIVGTVRWKRAYYVCRSCQAVHYGGDKALGIDRSGYSPLMQKFIAEACSMAAFRDGLRLIGELIGAQVSLRAAEEIVRRQGGRMEDGSRQLIEKLWAGEIEGVRRRGGRMYISYDGTAVRTKDGWKEARVAGIYWGKRQEGGRDEPEAVEYTAAVAEGWEQFGRRVYAQSQWEGIGGAEEVVVIGDGARWVWELAEEHFPGAVQILDFYHASRHLWEAACLIWGEGSEEGRQAVERWERELLAGGVWKVIDELSRWARRKRGEKREALRRQVGYFSRNADRMRYDEYLAAGMHIGSGVAESACRHILGRLKGAGKRWRIDTAQAVVSVLCTSKSRWREHIWSQCLRPAA